MEAIKGTLADMMASFNKRMDHFAAELDSKTSTKAPGIAAEFATFRELTLISLKSLQQQIELLARQTDSMETRNRRGMLLIHGVPEVTNEDTSSVAVQTIVNRMKISGFSGTNVKSSQRMGRSASSGKPRPIIINLNDQTMRDKIWSSKTLLKASGVTLSEFLTRPRHTAFMLARKKFGVTKCWTRDGCIHIVDPNEVRHRVTTVAEVESIPSSVATKEAAVPAKVRRAAARK